MKLQDTIVAIAIGMFGALAASGQALAASAMPASGEGPWFDGADTTASTLTRAEVHAQAVAAPPASGEQQAGRREVQTASTLTRAEVHAGAVQSPPAGGEQAFAAAPMAPASQQAARAVASDALAREYRTSANEDG